MTDTHRPNRLPCGHIGRFNARYGEHGCWSCRQAVIRAACDHSRHSARPHWAGILGWRYYCGACGERVLAPESQNDGGQA